MKLLFIMILIFSILNPHEVEPLCGVDWQRIFYFAKFLFKPLAEIFIELPLVFVLI